jgi:hypothetical protein
MDQRMTIHDRRLKGGIAPPIAQNTFAVDDKWTLRNAFLWVHNYAKAKGGLQMLNIMCHGFYGWEDNAQLQACIAVGGYGLQLCKEGLTLHTIDTVASLIKGQIKEITIYACGTASTQSNNRGSAGDGKYFCKQLAAKTKAVVYGADREQVYNYWKGHPEKPIDFGDWEGNVFRFWPDGRQELVESRAAATLT